MGKGALAPGAEALAAAARVVEAVAFAGRSADTVLASSASSARHVPLPALRAIALGTIRWYLRLVPALERLLERPSGVPRAVRALLAVAAHQLEFSRNAPQEIVHSAVDAARALQAPGSAALVNAVLRRYVGERVQLLAQVDAELARRTAHPAWLVERLMDAWGERTPCVLEANNAHPPMTLRIDLTRATRSEYLERLRTAGIDAQEIQWLDSAAVLARPMAVTRLPGFSDGLVSVQDAGAQLAAPMLAPGAGMRVLDACAAPGGKTGHLLELLGPGADVTAVDIDRERLGLIRDNLTRLQRTACLVEADVRRPDTFWDGRPFDRILIDAPCSSTGVIRRHPDIKLLRRPTDVSAFASMQLEILRAATRMLVRGGRMLYSTCSVLPEENEETVAAFLASEPAVSAKAPTLLTPQAPGALERPIGLQVLPGSPAGTDGFYYACLEKATDAS